VRQLDERQQQLEQAAGQRDAWLEQHCDTLTYRDELARQVASRWQALGVEAGATQPQHLVDLLGPVPDDDTGRTRWTRAASRIEAYREQWDVDPQDLHQPPVDGVQYRDWAASVEASIKTSEMLQRLDALQLEHGADRSLSADRSLGIEL
jgi:hypothetical protein